MSESLIPTIASIGGGFFSGILVGYFLKKIIKILIFVAGGLVALLFYLVQHQIISVNLEKLEVSTAFILASVVSSFDKMTQIGDATSTGIPLTGGLSAGLAIGFIKG